MTDRIFSPVKFGRAALMVGAALSLLSVATPAFAGGGNGHGNGRHFDRGFHGGGYYGRGYSNRNYYRGGYYDGGYSSRGRYHRGGGLSGGEAALIAVGVIGGAILIDRALDDRRYDDRRYDNRRYDGRRYEDRRYEDRRTDDRRTGGYDDGYYYQRDTRAYENDYQTARGADLAPETLVDDRADGLLGAGPPNRTPDRLAVNAAFRECVAETRGAAGAGGLQVAMPGVPTQVETLADGSVRMTAQFRATNGRGEDYARRFVCEADDQGVRFLQID
ncbi:MAG: hypothetical protein ACKVS5_10530 [Parvularculaceae bacterium]